MNVSSLRVSTISEDSLDMSGAEFRAFKEDIRKNGQQVPIVVIGDEIIDGRKRFRACQELGIVPLVASLDPAADPVDAARSLNLFRTHYPPSQRAIYAARLATRPSGPTRQVSKFRDLPTVAEAARMTGVAPASVAGAKHLRRIAPPEVIRAVESGKMTIHAATQIVKNVPPEDQPGVVARAISEGRGVSRKSVLPQPERRRYVRPAAEQFEEAIRTASVVFEVIEAQANNLREHERWTEWEREMRRLRTILSRAIGGKRGGNGR